MDESSDFPDDLWSHIFQDAYLPFYKLKELLPLRTVCKQWKRIISSFSEVKSDSIERSDLSKLFEIFVSLKSFSTNWHTKFLPSSVLLTNLHTLTIIDSGPFYGGQTLLPYAQLKNLTKLSLANEHVGLPLAAFTFLQCLELLAPFTSCLAPSHIHQIYQYPHLTSLISNAEIFDGYTGHARRWYDSEGGWYEGAMVLGNRQGQGRQFIRKGHLWDGEFDKNEFVFGTLYHNFGKKRYVGQFKNGRMHGHGALYVESGILDYEGEFENNVKHGMGIDYYPTTGGKYFEGMFEAGLRVGLGVEFYPDGSSFEGTFKRSKVSYWRQIGTMHLPTGESFDCNFQRDGTVYVVYKESGDIFECVMRDGEIVGGVGTVTYKNGPKVQNLEPPNGFGTLRLAAPFMVEGNWTQRSLKLEGPATISAAMGNKIEANFEDGKRQGKVKTYYYNGQRFECDFVDDKPNAMGIQYFPDGTQKELPSREITFDLMFFSKSYLGNK